MFVNAISRIKKLKWYKKKAEKEAKEKKFKIPYDEMFNEIAEHDNSNRTTNNKKVTNMDLALRNRKIS